MTWWPGEQERMLAFYEGRNARLAHRAMLMRSLVGSPEAYKENLDAYYALLRRNTPEDEFEDTVPDTNQNVW
jgi:hypothetical protein